VPQASTWLDSTWPFLWRTYADVYRNGDKPRFRRRAVDEPESQPRPSGQVPQRRLGALQAQGARATGEEMQAKSAQRQPRTTPLFSALNLLNLREDWAAAMRSGGAGGPADNGAGCAMVQTPALFQNETSLENQTRAALLATCHGSRGTVCDPNRRASWSGELPPGEQEDSAVIRRALGGRGYSQNAAGLARTARWCWRSDC
jgi:hypothetical protein